MPTTQTELEGLDGEVEDVWKKNYEQKKIMSKKNHEQKKS
jgi:hypothetical protein